MFQSVASESLLVSQNFFHFSFQNAVALYRRVQLLLWRPLNYIRTYTIMNISLRLPEFTHSLCYIQEFWLLKFLACMIHLSVH